MRVEKHLFSRLLYSNPVCLLSVVAGLRANVMTITWLTPCDNKGLFVMSINKNRFSANLLKKSRNFVLSIPVAGMEELVLNIGTKSGTDCDKFSTLNIPVCAPGWLPVSGQLQTILKKSSALFLPQRTDELAAGDSADALEKRVRFSSEPEIILDKNSLGSKSPDYLAISSCVAHLVCSVSPSVSPDFSVEENDGHYILTCKIVDAFVNAAYWESGKIFVASVGHPPLLSFLGSQQFAHITKPDFWKIPDS